MSVKKYETAGGAVTVGRAAGVSRIEFYHPQSNALPGALLDLLAEHITTEGREKSTAVLILQSAGNRAFCAGASFDELLAIDSLDEGTLFFSGFAKVINAMRKCPKFILGRVQGKAVGGGVGLCAAVDYCFATAYSQVKLSELAIGIGPFVVGPAVERKIGASAFASLAINATEWKEPEWALDHGLYIEVLHDIDALDKRVNEMAEILKGYNPEAMRELKMVLWQGTEKWDGLLYDRAAVSGKLVLSEHTRMAIARFKDSRKRKAKK